MKLVQWLLLAIGISKDKKCTLKLRVLKSLYTVSVGHLVEWQFPYNSASTKYVLFTDFVHSVTIYPQTVQVISAF